jgi:pimeloyl-ACP methyl ester carboxylesterase
VHSFAKRFTAFAFHFGLIAGSPVPVRVSFSVSARAVTIRRWSRIERRFSYPSNASQDPPVTHQIVLLPGLLCDEAVWGDQRGALGAMAELVLESVSEDRLLVAGHSMGGRVALEVLRRAPERVARLALLDTGYMPRAAGEAGENERAQRLRLLELARTKGMHAMGNEWAPGMQLVAGFSSGSNLSASPAQTGFLSFGGKSARVHIFGRTE